MEEVEVGVVCFPQLLAAYRCISPSHTTPTLCLTTAPPLLPQEEETPAPSCHCPGLACLWVISHPLLRLPCLLPASVYYPHALLPSLTFPFNFVPRPLYPICPFPTMPHIYPFTLPREEGFPGRREDLDVSSVCAPLPTPVPVCEFTLPNIPHYPSFLPTCMIYFTRFSIPPTPFDCACLFTMREAALPLFLCLLLLPCISPPILLTPLCGIYCVVFTAAITACSLEDPSHMPSPCLHPAPGMPLYLTGTLPILIGGWVCPRTFPGAFLPTTTFPCLPPYLHTFPTLPGGLLTAHLCPSLPFLHAGGSSPAPPACLQDCCSSQCLPLLPFFCFTDFLTLTFLPWEEGDWRCATLPCALPVPSLPTHYLVGLELGFTFVPGARRMTVCHYVFSFPCAHVCVPGLYSSLALPSPYCLWGVGGGFSLPCLPAVDFPTTARLCPTMHFSYPPTMSLFCLSAPFCFQPCAYLPSHPWLCLQLFCLPMGGGLPLPTFCPLPCCVPPYPFLLLPVCLQALLPFSALDVFRYCLWTFVLFLPTYLPPHHFYHPTQEEGDPLACL